MAGAGRDRGALLGAQDAESRAVLGGARGVPRGYRGVPRGAVQQAGESPGRARRVDGRDQVAEREREVPRGIRRG